MMGGVGVIVTHKRSVRRTSDLEIIFRKVFVEFVTRLRKGESDEQVKVARLPRCLFRNVGS